MGVCATYANLKNIRKANRSDDIEKSKCQRMSKEHPDAQSRERMKAMYYRDKALNCPSRYFCLMLTGMDQKKISLPHFAGIPKDMSDGCLIQMNLVVCLSYHTVIKLYVFLTNLNVHNYTQTLQ
jgi:hypothetical protein